MKKIFIFACYCLSSIAFSAPIQERRITPSALHELTTALGIPPTTDIIPYTQTHWLRSSGQERWEMHELPEDKRLFVLNWAGKEGLFSAYTPALSTYDRALILGATTPCMQERLDYLKQLWLQGVRFKEIVWLTGDRALDPRIDKLTDRCGNESQAARILWEETSLPEEMRTLTAVFIATPMSPQGKRPNTQDTLYSWLATSPAPGSSLFISDQPFCGYQFAIIKSTLPASYDFDVVGPGKDPSCHPAAAAITLDAIARWLYQENLTSPLSPSSALQKAKALQLNSTQTNSLHPTRDAIRLH